MADKNGHMVKDLKVKMVKLVSKGIIGFKSFIITKIPPKYPIYSSNLHRPFNLVGFALV